MRCVYPGFQFSVDSIMTFRDGAIDGVVSGYPSTYYKNATIVGTATIQQFWDMDEVKMTSESYRNFGASIDALLKPFLIQPIRNIVLDFSPFY